MPGLGEDRAVDIVGPAGFRAVGPPPRHEERDPLPVARFRLGS
jgi:hypothetical protein